MAVSKYFNHINNKSEQDLFENLIIEQIKLSGYDVWYLPRTIEELDNVLGDPVKTIYENAYEIEALIPSAGNFSGDQGIMSKFGFRTNETTEFYISKKRFNELNIPDYIRPKNGDLIYIGNLNDPDGSFANDFFEINDVSYDLPGFQFGRQICYKLSCESFTYSHEKVRTGLDAIDSMEIRTEDIEKKGSATNKHIKDAAELLVKWNTNNPFGDM